MRPPASFAPLVTLMAVASTTAAPVRVNSDLAVPPFGNHRLGRGMLPISDSKLPNQVYSEACKCMVDATEDIVHAAVGVEGKAKGMGQTVQDNARVPDTRVQVEVNAKGADTPINPQPQPQPESQPDHEPEGSIDCLDPTQFQDNVCVAIKLKDGQKGLDAIQHDADTTGVKVKAPTNAASDGVHSVNDKVMNVVHVAQEGTHAMANVDIGPNTPSCEVLAVKGVEVKPIKDDATVVGYFGPFV